MLRRYIAALACLASCAPTFAADSLLTFDDIKQLKIYHAYSASDGRSYVEEISVPAENITTPGSFGAQMYFDLKPQAIHIARSATNNIMDWHYAGVSRHLIIPMQGDLVFDLGDNKVVHLKPGEAILAEDWTGKGHKSGCDATDKKYCVVIDILVEPNPRVVPLRDPPKQ